MASDNLSHRGAGRPLAPDDCWTSTYHSPTISPFTDSAILYLLERQARAELKQINRELKQYRAQLAALEERRSALLTELGEQAVSKPG